MNKLFASITPETNLEDIKLLLADVKDKLDAVKENPDDVGVEQQPFDPATQQIIDDLTLSIDQLSDYLDKIQKTQDDTWLQQIKDEATNFLTTYTKIYDATLFYNKTWFSNLFISVEAKVDLAGYLLSIFEPLCKSNLDTLRLISERDPDIIQFIQYPRSL